LEKFTRSELLWNVHKRTQLLSALDKSRKYYKEDLAEILYDYTKEYEKEENFDNSFYPINEDFKNFIKT